jgi:predicted TIM-barrel fold metal-dependent hydrolase
MTSHSRIDFHHHLSPPAYVAALKACGLGLPPTFAWTPQKSLDEMGQAGISLALLSVTMPGVSFLGAGEAIRVARESNDYGARLRAEYPGKFGLLATLPMPDVDATLREIDYALDTLRADGISIMTSYGDRWLGDPGFYPVLEALHVRHAVVHVHPVVAPCCAGILPHIPPVLVEVGTDTTRVLADLVFTGAADRFSGIRFVFSHGGGTMPFLIDRFLNLPRVDRRYAALTEDMILGRLRGFFYDTAAIAHPAPLSALTNIIPVSRLVFGSDFPFRSAVATARGLVSFFGNDDMRAVEAENATRLLTTLTTA